MQDIRQSVLTMELTLHEISVGNMQLGNSKEKLDDIREAKNIFDIYQRLLKESQDISHKLILFTRLSAKQLSMDRTREVALTQGLANAEIQVIMELFSPLLIDHTHLHRFFDSCMTFQVSVLQSKKSMPSGHSWKLSEAIAFSSTLCRIQFTSNSLKSFDYLTLPKRNHISLLPM
jgi:hypothetical protein